MNPYDPNKLYVTDVDDNDIKKSVDGGQHWHSEPVLTDIATNHGEFVFGCDKLVSSFIQGFGSTCSLSGMAFDRRNPGIRVAAMYPGGLAFSRDGGAHWIELDVTNNVPRTCHTIGPCTLAWDLIEYPQSVFYEGRPDPQTGATSIYVSLIGKSVKRVAGNFATLNSFDIRYCATCGNLALRRSVPTKVVAVVSATGANIPLVGANIPLVKDSQDLFRGNFLFDSEKMSNVAFHFLINDRPTKEFKHTLSKGELRSGIAACSPPELRVRLTPQAVGRVNTDFVPVTATIRATSECGSTVAVKLVSVTGDEPFNPGDVRGARFGADVRRFEFAKGLGAARSYPVAYSRVVKDQRLNKSSSHTGRTYTYRGTDLFGNATEAKSQVTVPARVEKTPTNILPALPSVSY